MSSGVVYLLAFIFVLPSGTRPPMSVHPLRADGPLAKVLSLRPPKSMTQICPSCSQSLQHTSSAVTRHCILLGHFKGTPQEPVISSSCLSTTPKSKRARQTYSPSPTHPPLSQLRSEESVGTADGQERSREKSKKSQTALSAGLAQATEGGGE